MHCHLHRGEARGTQLRIQGQAAYLYAYLGVLGCSMLVFKKQNKRVALRTYRKDLIRLCKGHAAQLDVTARGDVTAAALRQLLEAGDCVTQPPQLLG